MAHYALLKLEDTFKVINLITGKNENELDENGNPVDWEEFYSEITGYTVKRTSYNTRANVHLLGGTPFRYNYAMIGGEFMPSISPYGAFVDAQPYPSWNLNYTTMAWEAPYPEPEPGKYYWFEMVKRWVPIEEV